MPFGDYYIGKKGPWCMIMITSFFWTVKRKKQRKAPGCNKTAKNLLETTSLDKLLTTFVKQCLRSSLSYGFIYAVFCEAGLKACGRRASPLEAKQVLSISTRHPNLKSLDARLE